MRNLILLLLLFINFTIYAQQKKSPVTDTSKLIKPITDTLPKNSKTVTGLDSKIHYTAEDSIKFSIDGNIVYLYGNARISHEEMELSSGFIRLDQKNKLLFASGKPNKYSVYKGRPILKQGNEPPVTSDSLLFNFDTKRGKSFGTLTDIDGGYIQANQFKKNEYNEGFFKHGIYSTCSLPEPHTHFGIHITRGIVTEKQVISGPAYLVIEHVPLPVGVPFGFFPKTNKRASGLLFPAFGEDGTRGFFMRGLGWYFGINDYIDAEVRGTLYSKLSYETNLLGRYRKNYKYNGSLNFSYASLRSPTGIEGTPSAKPSKQFNLQWTHSQSAEANPGTNFSANVNVGTSSYFRDTRVAGDRLEQATNSNISSGISYQRTFLDNRFNFSSSLRHSQNLQTKKVDLDLPTFQLGMSTFNPFESKGGSSNPKWYERISVGYSMQGSNSVSQISEDRLFRKSSLREFRNGIQHSIPVSMSFNVAQYFQFTSGISYAERWTLQTIRRSFDPTIIGTQIRTDTVQGFKRNYDYSLNTGVSTKIYGMMPFRKGNLVAIRHVITPNLNFSYRPDFSGNNFGFFRDVSGVPSGTTIPNSRYSIFEQSAGGGPGIGRSANMNFSVENNIEAKVRTKSDTASAFEKIPIIQGLTFSGNYDFEATGFNKLSTIFFGGRTAFFKQKLNLTFTGSFDPYRLDSLNQRTGFLFKEGQLARLASFGVQTGYSLNPSSFIKRQKDLTNQQNNPNTSARQQQDISEILRNPNGFVDFNIPWNITASYSFQYSNNGFRRDIVNSLNFNGDFSVTPKWKVSYTSGWDFRANTLTTTSFSINRDLHCWDLAMSWVPFGQYKGYSVDLRVRASMLQDLKLSRRSPSNGGYFQ